MLAGFLALLSRYSGHDDVVTGLYGVRVLRADLSGDPSFRELMARLREEVRDVEDRQSRPFAQPVRVAFELAGAATAQVDLNCLVAVPGTCSIEYDRDLFDAATAARMAVHFQRLLADASDHPERRLSELCLASGAEGQQLFHDWNDNCGAGPAPGPLHALFEAQAERTPDAVALAAGELSLTYAELDARACRLARKLRALGVGPEVPVGVFLERSAEIVVALLGILKAGGVYLPLDPLYPRERVSFMLADAQAPGVVSQERLRDAIPGHEGWMLCVDGAEEEPASGGPVSSGVAADNLAYLIYTSGSTGRPKGVAVRQGSAAVLVEWAASVFPPQDLAGVLASTSICFDLSVFEIFVPLSLGGRVILAPDALALPGLTGRGVTVVNTVPSAAAELARTGGLPPSVTTVNLAGEALPQALAADLYRLPHVRKVFNLYGPSEDTTYSTCALIEQGDPRPPAIGRPIRDSRAFVVDRRLRPVPLGAAGELLLAGAGLARGYIGRPDLTAERFVPDPFSGEPGARCYRTGDLARFRPDGSLAFLGRIDHQVKIRGFRIELAEVEAALSRHPGVRESVVVAREDSPGERRLVAYVAPAAEAVLKASALRSALMEILPVYMLPSAFVIVLALPRTPNGKLDRRALPVPVAERREGAAAAPRSPVELILAAIWSQALGVPDIGADDHFFDLGGHSLLASHVLVRTRDALGVELPQSVLFAHPTLAGLAGEVETARRQALGFEVPPLRPVPRDGRLPLAFAQQRLWLLDQVYPGLTAYNIPTAFRLEGGVDEAALEAALNEIVRRHEVLRTRLRHDGEGPYQEVEPHRRFVLPRIDLTCGSEDEIRSAARAEAGRPFRLAQGPPFRAALMRLGGGGRLLLLTVHHVAADGWSLDLLQRELEVLYAAFAARRPSPLPELPVQYADFAVWQRRWLQGAVREAQLAYWRNRLDRAPAFLELPADRLRPEVPSFRGHTAELLLSARLRETLLTLGRHRGATLFMTLLAGFAALLQRYTGQDDLVLGSVIANRNRSELEGLIGFFANTLALRTDLSGEPACEDLLVRVRETALGAYAHQDLPFEQVVEELHPQRDPGRNPIFQVLFQLLSAPPSFAGGALRLRRSEREHGTAKFDLHLYLSEPEEGGLAARLESASELFDPATAHRLLGHYRTLVEGIAADPRRRICELPLLTEDERHQTLEWNEAALPGGAAELPIHERVKEQARRTPDAVALVAGASSLTYRELTARANRLARHLLALGIAPEARVGIFLERSPEMVVALLGALGAGGVSVPLDPAYPRERTAVTLSDAAAGIVVTQESLLPRLPETQATVVVLERDRAALESRSAAAPPPAVSPENLAYLIYTSGSTGRPKGIAIRHRSAAILVEWSLRAFTAGELRAVLASTSICFDMSVFEIFVPLSCGGRLILAGDALALAALPAGCGVTLVNAVPSGVAELLRLDAVPDSVLTVNLGGEALQGALVEDLYRRTAVRRVLNLYGPSEDTTYSTVAPVAAGERREPPIGRPLADTRTHLLDRRLQPLPVGVPGELFLGGEGLARGYWNRPDLTAERFLPNPFSREPGRRLYRTGDRVRRLADGNLGYLGRLDHQVKIRGYRIELGEIESALARCPEIAAAVVAAREDTPGDRRLVAYVVPGDGQSLSAADLRRRLAQSLPGPLVPSAFVLLKALPLTPSGKVDRQALPAPRAERSASAGDASARPRNAMEELVAGIWAELLGLDEVGIHDHFFDLGGHSLLATQVISRLRERLQVELPLRALFVQPTVAALAEALAAATVAGRSLPPILPAGEDGEVPLSFGQQRLLLLERLHPGNPAYNLPTGFRLAGPLCAAALERSLSEVVRRHHVLRTTFPRGRQGGGEVSATPAFSLSCVDLRALSSGERNAEWGRLSWEDARRPFDLARGPVIRALLLRLGERDHALFLSLHHIAGDAWSLGVLGRELTILYGAFREGRPSPLRALPIQYSDFARWQQRWLAAALDADLAFWVERLRGAPPAIELPADRPRPAEQTLRGGAAKLLLPQGLQAALIPLGRREGATLFMTLLAGFLALLQRYTGADDLVVGSPIANRARGETEDLIGFFLNTLVLRADLSGEPDVRQLLGRVRQTALAAWAHQDLPFEKLVEKLKPERDPSRNPVFQVSFQLLNTRSPVPELAGLEAEALERDHGTAKFDLELTLAETSAGLACFAEHSSDLFEAASIERLLGHYRRLLGAMAAEPERPVGELPLISAAEHRQLIAEWNDTARDYPAELCLPHRIEAQSRRTPEAVAVTFAGGSLSYRELAVRAGRLAHRLRSHGVAPEVLVGICVERSLEMIVGILGILEAGGAYVPLDPGYPEERLAFMLEDSATPVLLTQGSLVERLARLLPPATLLIPLDPDAAAPSGPAEAPQPLAGPDHPAYAIYTSGSTGRPKGAINSHRAIVNRLLWMQEAYGLGPDDRVLHKTPFSFDVSVWELFWPLMVGARLVIARPGGHQESAYLVDLIERERITTVHFVPSMLQLFLAEPGVERLGTLRRVIASGETLSFDLEERFFARSGAELHNLYGPTEAAVDVTAWACSPGGEGPPVPIGRPIANVRVHVLDRALRPAPVGVAGECCLAGVQLARGYLGRPGLTAERFVPDPLGAAGERLYHTGDLVRRRADGTLVHLGRLDHQVKVRGLRIELGEIEAVLAGHGGVREAVVAVREFGPDEPRLVAYVVPEDRQRPEASGLREHLRAALPDYMVPSSFVILDALPLTPNGKVDRKALPAPDRDRPRLRDYVAPRSATEEILARIWAGVLGLDRVSVADDFFDLGGHSLLGLHVITHIRSHFGLELPLGTLFRYSTVEKMAAMLEGRAAAEPSPLALLGGWSSSRPPFFCLHGVGGNVFRFVQLARPSRRPFYGVQGWSDLDDVGHLGSVVGMAKRYMTEIRKLQPRGPYFLGGVCLGCMVAFEMARRFEMEGEAVAFLGFFDTSASSLPARVLDTFNFEAGIAGELGIPISREEMKRVPRREHLAYVLEQGRRRGILPAGFTRQDAQRYVEVFRLNLTAFVRYTPPPSRLRATLFATASDDVPGDPTWGWRALALKGVEVVSIPGDNASMLRPPHVEVFAARLGALLDMAEARSRRSGALRLGFGRKVSSS